jgi:hypothetical protein
MDGWRESRRALSGNAHVVVGFDGRCKIANEMTVDRDLALPDQRLAGAT